MLSFNALSAADEIIIPLPAERPALDGIAADLLRFIHEVVWEKYDPTLKIRGILPTDVQEDHDPLRGRRRQSA